MNRVRLYAWVLALALHATAAGAQDTEPVDAEWPVEISWENATVTVYQPQVESFEGNRLEARAAVSVALDDGAPQFGAIWIEARVQSDRSDRMATLYDLSVPRVRFAGSSDEQQQKLSQVIEESVPASGLSISLDRLITDMDASGRSETEAELKHDPPQIRYRTEPTILISLDGDPIFQKAPDGSGVERVLNTPFTMLRFGGALYLAAGGGLWYRAERIEGPWTPGVSPPAQLAALEPEDAQVELGPDQKPPDILVATVPTELIVSGGPPNWTPMADGALLYVDNSDSDVFLEIETQHYYVLLSGRWYRGVSMGNDWQWDAVPNDALPDAFAKIPPDSVNGHVLPQVAGTPQARDAVLDNTIPQTAAVKREGGPPIRIEYDGEPKFEPIEGIPARYAVNTPSAIFQVGGHYWACEQGIWYDSASATGPWAVSTEVPEVLYRIPASNPHYNVTYVKVYQSTPEVVYVGYTPAYLGSYVYAGSVVYGTGWYYRPWYGRYYYPRYPTWGFNVSYNPWTGWGFGVSWSNGPFSFGIGFGGGWFGPVGYRPWARPYVGGGFRKNDININRNVNVGDINIDRSRDFSARQEINNVYNRGSNRNRVENTPGRDFAGQRPGRPGAERPGAERPGQLPATRPGAERPGGARPEQRPVTRPADRPNDVLTDRDGNVYRRGQGESWEQRKGDSWQKADNLDRPSTRDVQRPSTRPESGGSRSRPSTTPATRPQLERDYRARQQGAQRSQSYQRQRSGGGAYRGGGGGHRGGGHRGGGGGRRR